MELTEISEISFEERKNRDAIDRLSKQIYTSRMVCFVGAGLSSAPPLKYPRWNELIKELEQLVCKTCGHTEADLVVDRVADKTIWAKHLVEFLVTELGQTQGPSVYRDFIDELYKDKQPGCTEMHELLMKLPFQHFITTNYDPSLENAYQKVHNDNAKWIDWQEDHKVGKLLRRLDFLEESERTIFHIHGRFDRIGSIVLTSSDYDSCYDVKGYMQPAMWGFLSMKSLFFIGFSFDGDDEYSSVARRVNRGLKQSYPSHFGAIGLAETEFKDYKKRFKKRNQFKDEYGVEPIFYPVYQGLNGDPDHAELTNLLRQLYTSLAYGKPPVVVKKEYAGGAIGRADGANILKSIMRKKFNLETGDVK